MRYSRLGDTGLIVSRLSLGSTVLELPQEALDELDRASDTRQPYPQWFSSIIRDPVADNALRP
jgi:hypothetical protein